jgi:uncharacterized protein (TIGR02271 family)
MLTMENIKRVVDSDAYSVDDKKIGSVKEVYVDDRTEVPEFATVKTGMLSGESFVPLAGADFDNGKLKLSFDKDKIEHAPSVSHGDGHLDEVQERRVYDHYGLPYSEAESTSGLPTPEGVGHDTSGPNTDTAMTRSEEHVDVGKKEKTAGKARLRKYVETENVQETVPVKKEKAVLEREPVTEGNVDQALSGPEISEEEHEVVLHEEKPVVEKRTEPVERVRVGKVEETDEATVSEKVRKEQIEAEGDIEK